MLVDKNKTMKETQHKALAEMLGFFLKIFYKILASYYKTFVYLYQQRRKQ